MGVPLLAVGASAGALMPRAGAWMQTVKNFFGVSIPRGVATHEVLLALGRQIGDINPYVTAVALTTMLASAVVRHWVPRLPHLIAAMLTGSVTAAALNAG